MTEPLILVFLVSIYQTSTQGRCFMRLKRVTNQKGLPTGSASGMSRRGFLRTAGIGAGAVAMVPALAKTAKAENKAGKGKANQIKTICNNCAVGCGLIAEEQNGVWVGAEPWFEHPINRGSLCSKGAAGIDRVKGEKRLRYPMKLEGGKWKRIGWDQALGEISEKLLSIRKKHGSDSMMILGSAHHNNETAYSLRKFAAMWGTNNIDHQARI